MRVNQEILGTGRLEATRDLLVSYDDEIAAITEGQTRIVPDHELVERNPLAFVVADPDDFATRQWHTALICEHIIEREGI